MGKESEANLRRVGKGKGNFGNRGEWRERRNPPKVRNECTEFKGNVENRRVRVDFWWVQRVFREGKQW